VRVSGGLFPSLEVPRAATDCPSGEKASRVRPGVCTGRASTDDGAGWWGAMGGFPRPDRGGEGEAREYGYCWRRVTCWAVGDESAEGLMKRRGGLETTTTDGRVFETRRRAGDEAENCSCKSSAGRRKGAAPAGPKTSSPEHRRRPPSWRARSTNKTTLGADNAGTIDIARMEAVRSRQLDGPPDDDGPSQTLECACVLFAGQVD
jgi:hypothetical protein